jgi:hypothetical protein
MTLREYFSKQLNDTYSDGSWAIEVKKSKLRFRMCYDGDAELPSEIQWFYKPYKTYFDVSAGSYLWHAIMDCVYCGVPIHLDETFGEDNSGESIKKELN